MIHKIFADHHAQDGPLYLQNSMHTYICFVFNKGKVVGSRANVNHRGRKRNT